MFLQPAYEATNIILFFDPEYLTAANYRKRRITELLRQNGQGSDLTAIFNRELLYVTSVLTSPLHRQSKSPTLWAHRFWLLDFSLQQGLENHSPKSNPMDCAQNMFYPVFRSAEQHPKNYYAWQYARKMMSRAGELPQNNTQLERNNWLDNFVAASATLVKKWCLQHPSDISGWSYLVFHLRLVKNSNRRNEIAGSILNFAIDVRSKQESIWVFIRSTLADPTLKIDGHLQIQLEALEEELRTTETVDNTFRGLVVQTSKWISLYRKEHAKQAPPIHETPDYMNPY